MADSEKNFFTTHDVARLCGVDFTTVIDWCDQGKLLCQRTPGGHRRIPPSELALFLRRYGYAVPEELAALVPVRILVVDDDGMVRATLSRGLATAFPQAEIEAAPDGFEAGRRCALLRPDLVVLDINMPGADGYSVAKSIRADARLAHTRILSVSGEPGPDVRERILAAGADAFLAKPFDLMELLDAARRLLQRGGR